MASWTTFNGSILLLLTPRKKMMEKILLRRKQITFYQFFWCRNLIVALQNHEKGNERENN